ncbi:hypothetical protein JFL47_13845 [Haemophilus haemoglobinophilus]|nr:hypothetical protein [Canicola haemoglobinophilus]MBN6712278.1 hypothetical protein [Canicola haemoglobinophilus]
MMLIEGDGYVPNKSNIWDFNITQIDEGSGGYWRYGKDDKFYYFFSLWEEDVYFYISKDNSCANFNEKDINTWCNAVKVKQK